MFKELGAVAGLLKNQGKLAEAMQNYQNTVAALTAEASVGAGYVTVKVNGKNEVVSVRISDDAMKLNDRELLEDLVTAAINQALTRMRTLIAAETQKLTANMGIPPGMANGLPGMPGSGA